MAIFQVGDVVRTVVTKAHVVVTAEGVGDYVITIGSVGEVLAVDSQRHTQAVKVAFGYRLWPPPASYRFLLTQVYWQRELVLIRAATVW